MAWEFFWAIIPGMRFILILKAIAGFLVLGVMGGTAYLMNEYTGSVTDMPGTMMERQRKVEFALRRKAEQGVKSDNEPGEKAFQRAREFLAMESMAEAEEKLNYIVNFYPSAKCAGSARRILGEINLDHLLDPEWKEGKIVLTAKKGDTFSGIVRKNKTTMDNLVHLSNLKRADHRSLRPGDKLTVMPLELRVVIDIRRKTLTLWREGGFIKEYRVLKISCEGRGDVRHLKLGSIWGLYRGKAYPGYSKYYRLSSKVIFLSDKSLVIRAVPEENQDDFGSGFFLARADMEELPLLLRPGNDVEIRN